MIHNDFLVENRCHRFSLGHAPSKLYYFSIFDLKPINTKISISLLVMVYWKVFVSVVKVSLTVWFTQISNNGKYYHISKITTLPTLTNKNLNLVLEN